MRKSKFKNFNDEIEKTNSERYRDVKETQTRDRVKLKDKITSLRSAKIMGCVVGGVVYVASSFLIPSAIDLHNNFTHADSISANEIYRGSKFENYKIRYDGNTPESFYKTQVDGKFENGKRVEYNVYIPYSQDGNLDYAKKSSVKPPVPAWYLESEAYYKKVTSGEKYKKVLAERKHATSKDVIWGVTLFNLVRIPFTGKFWIWVSILALGGGVGVSVYTFMKKRIDVQNMQYDTSDMNTYENDSHIMTNEELFHDFDFAPDVGAVYDVGGSGPSTIISHINLKNKGLKKCKMGEFYDKTTDVDGDVFYKGDLILENGVPKTVKADMIDMKFGSSLFDGAGIDPNDKSKRIFFDATKIPYNIGNKNRDRLKDYDTLADLINDDWKMPLIERQQPAGAYIVDTAPANTMVLAITRGGKGQRYIEPYIDLLLRQKRGGNIILNDPKGELAVKFYVPAAKRGYEPILMNLINPIGTDIYNPLARAVVSAREFDITEMASIIDSTGKTFFPADGDDPMWDNAANNAFKRVVYGLIDYYSLCERLTKIYNGSLINGSNDEFRNNVNMHYILKDKTPPRVMDTIGEYKSLDRMWGNVTLYNSYLMFSELSSYKINRFTTEFNKAYAKHISRCVSELFDDLNKLSNIYMKNVEKINNRYAEITGIVDDDEDSAHAEQMVDGINNIKASLAKNSSDWTFLTMGYNELSKFFDDLCGTLEIISVDRLNSMLPYPRSLIKKQIDYLQVKYGLYALGDSLFFTEGDKIDVMTLYFKALSLLPRNNIRQQVLNAHASLLAMASSDKTLASVYGVATTAMSFFADPTIVSLTSGSPDQSIDLAGFSFPRRIGFRLHAEFVRKYGLKGRVCHWSAYEDKACTIPCKNGDFSHSGLVDGNNWCRYYFDGKFDVEKLNSDDPYYYIRCDIENSSGDGTFASFYFKLRLHYKTDVTGRKYIKNPVTKQKIIKDGVLEAYTQIEETQVTKGGKRDVVKKVYKDLPNVRKDNLFSVKSETLSVNREYSTDENDEVNKTLNGISLVTNYERFGIGNTDLNDYKTLSVNELIEFKNKLDEFDLKSLKTEADYDDMFGSTKRYERENEKIEYGVHGVSSLNIIIDSFVKYSEQPKIMFMITPPHLQSYAQLLLILIGQLTNMNFSQSYLTKANQKPLYDTRMILDEVGNLKSNGHGINNLDTFLSIGLGQSQYFTLILQSLQQLESLYGGDMNKVLEGNVANTVFLKSTDSDMLETLSKKSGVRHVARTDTRQINRNAEKLIKFGSTDGNISETTSIQEEAVLTVNDLQKIGDTNTSVVFSSGRPVIVNRNETCLPMSYRLHAKNPIYKGGNLSLATIPNMNGKNNQDAMKNKPDFMKMTSFIVSLTLIYSKYYKKEVDENLMLHNVDIDKLSAELHDKLVDDYFVLNNEWKASEIVLFNGDEPEKINPDANEEFVESVKEAQVQSDKKILFDRFSKTDIDKYWNVIKVAFMKTFAECSSNLNSEYFKVDVENNVSLIDNLPDIDEYNGQYDDDEYIKLSGMVVYQNKRARESLSDLEKIINENEPNIYSDDQMEDVGGDEKLKVSKDDLEQLNKDVINDDFSEFLKFYGRKGLLDNVFNIEFRNKFLNIYDKISNE